MMNDIVPELLEQIQKRFNTLFNESKKIASIQAKIDKGIATYVDASNYAVEVGQLLALSFQENITEDILPDGRMYFNVADRILNDTLGNNHKLISTATLQIQETLNAKAGLGLKGVDVPLYKNKVSSLVNRLDNEEHYEDVAWLLNEPIVTFSQQIVDDTLKANIEFQAKSGMRPTIVRTVSGHDPCEWCLRLSGTYEYPNVPQDIYKRHDRCRCTVEYNPGNNKRQNVWTKDWVDPEEKELIEMRKTYGL